MLTNADARRDTLAACTRAAGVVGAGGAGYAFADKLLSRPYRTLIINAAQSEPLFAKDWAVLAQYAECVLGGADALREALDLRKVFLAVREEFASALPDLASCARQHQVALSRLPDNYPLGYEKILKRELLGVAFDSPAANEALVVNAETLRNVSWAVNLDRALTTKVITLAGAVAHTISLEVPIGTPFADCLAHAGGASLKHYVAFENGVLGGQAIAPDAAWVSATTLGYVLLPPTHSAAGQTTDVSLKQRRAAFFTATLAGRTQPMSAAYALFDLTAYRRQRPAFHALKSATELPERVRITPCGGLAQFTPCVAVGQSVERGTPIAHNGALDPASAGITRHASVKGVVEAADAKAIVIRRSDCCARS